MEVAEFDKFADEYHNLHQENIRITGETPEYFAEYKIRDLRRVVNSFGVNSENILDFGMGIGNSTPFLSEYFPDSNLHGVDVSEKSLAIASERYECLGDFWFSMEKLLHFPMKHLMWCFRQEFSTMCHSVSILIWLVRFRVH